MIVFGRLSREQIVFGLVVALCVSFALSLPGFMTANDILNLVQTVSILGILGVAMESIAPLTALESWMETGEASTSIAAA